MGCEVVKVYREHGISGAEGRPEFDRLCRDATKREFDAIMAWSVDRLGRSLQDLVKFLSEIHALKIDLYLHQQGLETTTPAGKGDVSDDGRIRRARGTRAANSKAPRARPSPRADCLKIAAFRAQGTLRQLSANNRHPGSDV